MRFDAPAKQNMNLDAFNTLSTIHPPHETNAATIPINGGGGVLHLK